MKYIYILLVLNVISMPLCYGQQFYGFITQTVVGPNTVQRSNLNYVSDEQLYTTGGITFTYPAGLFSVPPSVNISILTTTPHGTTETFTTEISANSATSATVMVYNLVTIAGVMSIGEAAPGSVTIYLFAVGV